MKIGILRESIPDEKRVVLLPEIVPSFQDLKCEVWVEEKAGEKAFIKDQAYTKDGAEIKKEDEIISGCDVIFKINPLEKEEIEKMKEGQVVLAAFNPFFNKEIVEKLVSKKITSFSLDSVPRITRAQSMDILSSMATIAGYKAVLEAARLLPAFFPMFMSAAGTIKPAKILILGAGVAGLQAIATSRKLGAVVEVFDVRSAVKEEVMSLGGKFIEVEGAREDAAAGGYAVEQTDDFKEKQQQLIHDHAVKSDVVVCTAQIPGKPVPLLIKKETVDAMQPGSVIIDLAASTGGNCEVTKNNEIISHEGVTVVGKSNFPSEMPVDASRMFGKNVLNFFKLLTDEEGKLKLDFEDEVVRGTCLTHDGEIVQERIKNFYNQQ